MRTFATATKLEIREAAPGATGTVGTLAGYAAVFNRDSLEFSGWEKPWVERIAPGAFTRSLKEQPDVLALWSHDPAAPLARTPDGLRVEEDATGLRVEITIPDTGLGRDVLANVRSGIVRGMSFGFQASKVDWDVTDKARDVRTVKEAVLFEVSPVVWPAYPDTSISARRTVNDLEQVKAERDAHIANTAAHAAAQKTPISLSGDCAARLGIS